jgi:hypothetical protein
MGSSRTRTRGALQGRPLELPEPEPHPEPVNGATLLNDLASVIRRYVVMPTHCADAVALWALHTFLLDQASVSPRLAVTSPEKGCGKTTLLDVLSRLVWRPLSTADVSAAALFRVIEKVAPTLLIDEADTFLAENEELRGVLNSGHRRGGTVLRTVGDEHKPRSFATYSACAIASIGRLPGTLADRSITIELQRRRKDEPIESFRSDRTAGLEKLARMARRWTNDHARCIGASDPAMPEALFNRVADNWRPLLAIADAAGGAWPERARQTALAMTEGREDASRGVMALFDIRAVFEERKVDRFTSGDLASALAIMEDRPWGEWKNGKAITPNGLARLLKPFGVAPGTIRPESGPTAKGYMLASFADAFQRYLPERGSETVTSSQSLRH